VRFLGNRSSGRQGYALAKTAVARGADVTLVAANTELADPAGVKVVRVGSTLELADAVVAAAAGADAVVMAAAPADFRPAEQVTHKIKKRADGEVPEVTLVENPDILADLVRLRSSVADAARQVLVGFAAETGDAEGDVLDHGRQKLRRKGCDLLVVNDVTGGRVFGEDRNAAVILAADGSSTAIPDGPKVVLAHAVWDRVAALWDSHP
jgi:phosphopantothenoylcysteine decarboxylase/phosphopantothenate--cysteine ligase